MKALLSVLAAATLTLSAGLSQAAEGKDVYNQNCAMCHVPGLANAPKFGDKAAWGPRVTTGREALLASALKGKGAMPAKGGNPKLSDEDVGAAVDFMLAAVK
jgi:cytochrome c5